MLRYVSNFVLSALLVHICACTTQQPSYTYPSSFSAIHGWIDAQDIQSMRLHAWSLWKHWTFNEKDNVPRFELFYTTHEIFDVGPNAEEHHNKASKEEKYDYFAYRINRLEFPPFSTVGPIVSGNRYSPSIAHSLWGKKLHLAQTLIDINQQFIEQKTPIKQRAILAAANPYDPNVITIKNVFLIIPQDRASAIPFWNGMDLKSTTHPSIPTPDTWRQCIVIDPTNSLKPNSMVSMPCNQEKASPLRVFDLSDFYYFRINGEQAKTINRLTSSSDEALVVPNTSYRAREGDLALLIAMHINTKEVPEWTFQTFWWTPSPNTNDVSRPSDLNGPWAFFDMCTSYAMTFHPTNSKDGTPVECMNPFIEPQLEGSFQNEDGSIATFKSGAISNCMSCHNLAAAKENTSNPGTLKGPDYRLMGFISLDSSLIFDGYTQTDTMWSIPEHAK